ncbi:HlyD family type I secretion periplasmic adaptor subunit [Afifella sp. YEN Y35]|uniref:HlyD family type I secretion periplasmic adaptor subunit n=1 Tax=Afifella sp. YEN Y35 TaxID=3388337 RepID=UPI0039DF5457
MSLVRIDSRLPERMEGGLSASPPRLVMSHPLIIEETAPQRFIRHACVLIAIGILAFIIWSGFTSIHEVSQAQGLIVPAGYERVVQHYEGGVIDEILVRPGDQVNAGAPLFLLNDATTAENVDVAGRRKQNLLAQIEGLKALADNREPDFLQFGSDETVLASASAFAARREAQRDQRSLLKSQIEQARLLVSTYDAQLAALDDDLAFAEDNYARVEGLANKGYSTRTQLADRRKARQDVVNRTQITQQRKDEATERLVEAQNNLAAFETAIQSEIAREIQDLREALTTLEGDISKEGRRQDRLTVTSPVRGTVKSLDITTIGGIVASGQSLATIVPDGEKLHAETRLPVSEIGYVRIGLPARVKVSAFDFTRFGWIEGRVADISPASFTQDGTAPYYKVRIELDTEYLPFAPDARLTPGMAVSADIITGDKTLLAYFLSPIRKALNTAFAER